MCARDAYGFMNCLDTCETNADCEENQYCQGCLCTQGLGDGIICDTFTKADIDTYVSDCRNSGDCDPGRFFAFNTLDLTDYATGDINWVVASQYYTVAHQLIYCCQDGKNCDDGFPGCEPLCTACCSVEQCGAQEIRYNMSRIFICTGGACVTIWILIPHLYDGTDQYKAMDWTSVDLVSEVNTCTELRTHRTIPETVDGYCNERGDTSDTDIPCLLRIAEFYSTDDECPVNCTSWETFDNCGKPQDQIKKPKKGKR